MASTRTHEAIAARVRDICFSLPGVSETDSWGHPNFRVGGRTFAAFEIIDGRPSVAFNLGSEESDLVAQDPRCFKTPYGRGQWVSMFVDGRPPWKTVTLLLRRSYERRAPKRLLKSIAQRGTETENLDR